jgi:hypothetical protein
LHVGNCLWAAAVGNAAITVGNKRSGGGSISSASSWLSLYSIFLVVIVLELHVLILGFEMYRHIPFWILEQEQSFIKL